MSELLQKGGDIFLFVDMEGFTLMPFLGQLSALLLLFHLLHRDLITRRILASQTRDSRMFEWSGRPRRAEVRRVQPSDIIDAHGQSFTQEILACMFLYTSTAPVVMAVHLTPLSIQLVT